MPVVVRYQTKPERADENQALIEKVFDDLEQRQPKGFTYTVLRLDDQVSFVHLLVERDVADPDSLAEVPAFQEFTAGIAERCEVPPIASGASVVGAFG